MSQIPRPPEGKFSIADYRKKLGGVYKLAKRHGFWILCRITDSEQIEVFRSSVPSNPRVERDLVFTFQRILGTGKILPESKAIYRKLSEREFWADAYELTMEEIERFGLLA